MKIFLKAIILPRSQERGFAIPIIMTLGLVMVLISAALIFKSQSEDTLATSQRDTAKALAAAEAGLAQYQKLIDRNRNLAVYDKNNWNSSWASLVSSNQIETCDSTTTVSNALNSFQNLIVDGTNVGEYRLIDYDYLNTQSETASTALANIIVEGKVNKTVARISAQIPVRPEGPGLSTGQQGIEPVLWLSKNGIAGFTNINNTLKVNSGNIVISTGSGCSLANITNLPTINNLNNSSNQTVIPEPRSLPATLTEPTTNQITVNQEQLKAAVELPDAFGVNINDASYSTNNNSYSTVYRYIVTNGLSLSNEDLKIKTGTKVILFVRGNITFNATDSSNTVNINQNNTSPYLEIYGNNTTNQVIFSGSGNISGNLFIHAPQATVKVTGTPTVNLNGAIWVKNWDQTTGTVTLNQDTVTQNDPITGAGGTYSAYQFYTSKSSLKEKPLIYPATSWQTIEAN
jgi:hypothetical protein